MYERIFKRWIDIALSAVGLLVLSLVYLVIAIAVYVDDPGRFFSSKNVWERVKLFSRFISFDL